MGDRSELGNLVRMKKEEQSKVKGAFFLISNGYGTTKIPMRLGAEPETHLIYLMPLKTS